MTTFATIAVADLDVTFHASAERAEKVADDKDRLLATSADDLLELTGAQAVALYNATAAELDSNLTPVNKFANKATAAKRLWANLTDLAEVRAERAKASKARDQAAPAKADDYPAPAKAPRRNTGINLQPKPVAYPCRWGSKQAILVDMLSRKQGATLAELIAALSGGNKPWQEVTVKSGLNWDMNKIKGYGIRTTKRGDEDCYHLVLPEGLKAPLPHKKTKAQLEAAKKEG